MTESIASLPPGLSTEDRRALLRKLLDEQQAEPRVRPVSFAQRRLWFVCQLAEESWFYHCCAPMRLTGALQVAALQRALDDLVARHETLRTSFRFDPDRTEPVQVIAAQGPASLEIAERDPDDADVRELVHRIQREPFDLVEGPLFRARLIRVDELEHLLVLVIHHLVFDGWSAKVLYSDLAVLYAAHADGRKPQLPPAPLQYADYAALERQHLEGPAYEPLIGYWRDRLADLPTMELPTDHPRPPHPRHEGARASRHLALADVQALGALCTTESATTFMGVLAGLSVMLHRYCGQDDIVVGTPVANRDRRGVEGLIGFFVNSVVLRTDVSGDPTFRELLGRARAAVLGAFDHQDMPFEKLVEELDPQRDTSRNPLFQVTFDLQESRTAATPPKTKGVELQYVDPESRAVRFDLEIVGFRTAEALWLEINHRVDLFERGTIEGMLDHLALVLRTAAAAPDEPLSRLVLTDDQARRVLVERNDTAAPYARDAPVQAAFAQQVALRPDATAVVDDRTCLTYEELDRRANQLAHRLRAEGVGRGTRVAICLDRSADLAVALLGVLRTGAAYVPFDVIFPPPRLAHMLKDSAAPVLVTHERVRAFLPPFDGTVIALDGDAESLAREPGSDPGVEVRGGDVAYVIYTSGSTGRPKGVEVPHRGVVNLLESMRREPGFSERDVLLAVSTFSFDIAALELLLPIVAGGTVVIASAADALDGVALRRLLDRHGVTVVQATPATWQLLMQSGWTGRPGLRILCGGEALPRSLADELLLRVGEDGELWNMYGPTETTIWSTTTRVTSGDHPVDLGHPIANTRLYVLDERQRPVPDGAVGELVIGGDGLVRGYLDRPALTAARFVPDPFGGAGARLYRTGDRVRHDAHGRLQFLGRMDHQVKLRGFRIELAEIETVLLEHDAVTDAVVTVREDQPGDRRLVAYVVTTSPRPEASVLRTFLAARFPEYMVPSAFVALEALPLSTSGKLDRSALPRPAVVAGSASVAQPQTPFEIMLAEIWQEILGIEDVGREDNFFDLGGHSLLTVEIVRRMEARTGVRLGVAQLIMQNLGQIAELYARAVDQDARGKTTEGTEAPRSVTRRVLSALRRLRESRET